MNQNIFSKSWRYLHVLAITLLVILAFSKLFSFSEPLDFHSNVVHEREEMIRKEEEERLKWERLVAEAQVRQEQKEREEKEQKERE